MWNRDFTYQVNGKIITFDKIAGPWTVLEYTGTHLVMEADVYKRQVQEWKQYSKSERSMMLPGIYVTPRKSTVDVKTVSYTHLVGQV